MTTVLTRLRNPPFGTETSERKLMIEAAAQIDQLCAAVERAVAIIEDAEKDTNWCSGDPYSDEGPVKDLRALLASIRGDLAPAHIQPHTV